MKNSTNRREECTNRGRNNESYISEWRMAMPIPQGEIVLVRLMNIVHLILCSEFSTREGWSKVLPSSMLSEYQLGCSALLNMVCRYYSTAVTTSAQWHIRCGSSNRLVYMVGRVRHGT